MEGLGWAVLGPGGQPRGEAQTEGMGFRKSCSGRVWVWLEGEQERRDETSAHSIVPRVVPGRQAWRAGPGWVCEVTGPRARAERQCLPVQQGEGARLAQETPTSDSKQMPLNKVK